ncbi:two-component system sensor histidine kinase CreC [Aquincola sp. S2]|uniref:histidine kinase n=1 Tax=Pseudaquabacterium terrae TaxID=2732868 RepID=A0ABX2EKW5_9BURK|nr:two-component system sensor histidine kinase CreC [Aquabacterium terrae]NRF69275.1 two-component system sensor histidine kinase CreC [Aquabacterium terrae]
MHLGLRLLFGFFVITGLAAYFVLRVFLAEVQPSVREVAEDILVDAAHLLAEGAGAELAAMPAGGTLAGGAFAASVERYRARPVDAQIWGLHKRSLDFRVYVTDAEGRVVFDGGDTPATGADYSRWRDVARTLRGEYGARATREVQHDERTSVLYVAAPVQHGGRTIGVLTVAKPVRTIQQFIDRAERKILVAGAWLLGLSLAVGVGVTLWTVHSVRTLRRYAQQARAGERQAVPALPGELGELAQAMAAMRDRLEDRGHVEQAMRALTHELKSPLAAIGGAAELLHDALPDADREAFARQIGEQVQRLRELVDRLLELSKLESLRAPAEQQPVSLLALADALLAEQAAALRQRAVTIEWRQRDAASVPGDAEQLRLALSNLLANALGFAPPGSTLAWSVAADANEVTIGLRDHGPGVADYALPQLGQRFFSTPRVADGRKGSGLGLAIVRQIVLLHRGRLRFEPAQPGLQVWLTLPR